MLALQASKAQGIAALGPAGPWCIAGVSTNLAASETRAIIWAVLSNRILDSGVVLWAHRKKST